MSDKQEDHNNRFEAQAITSWPFIAGYTKPTAGGAASAARGQKPCEEAAPARERLQSPLFLMK